MRKNGLFFNHTLDADGRRGPPAPFGRRLLSVRRRIPRPALPVRLSVPASVADLYNITLGDVNRPLVEREWEKAIEGRRRPNWLIDNIPA